MIENFIFLPLPVLMAIFSGWLVCLTFILCFKIISSIPPGQPIGPYRQKFIDLIKRMGGLPPFDARVIMASILLGIFLLVLAFMFFDKMLFIFFKDCKHWEEQCGGPYTFIAMVSGVVLLSSAFLNLFLMGIFSSFIKVFDVVSRAIKNKLKSKIGTAKLFKSLNLIIGLLFALMIVILILILFPFVSLFYDNFSNILYSQGYVDFDYGKIQPLDLFLTYDLNYFDVEKNQIEVKYFLRNNTNFEKPIVKVSVDCPEYVDYTCSDKSFILESRKIDSFVCVYPPDVTLNSCRIRVYQSPLQYYIFMPKS